MLGVVNLGVHGVSIEEDLDLHASVGLGLQMQTPIGAMRLDYGWGEDGGRLHFNVGGNF